MFEVFSYCVGLETQYDLRLFDGRSENVGRLEVRVDGVWGTVCSNSWDKDDADVACRQLGFSRAYIPDGIGYYWLRITSLPIFFDGLNCNGNESYLWECANNGIGVHHDCFHWKAVFLVCLPAPHNGKCITYINCCVHCIRAEWSNQPSQKPTMQSRHTVVCRAAKEAGTSHC